MLRGDMFDLFLLEGCTAEDFITDKRIENLNELHKFHANIWCQVLKWSGKSNIFLHYSLEIKSWGYNFVFSAILRVISASSWDQKVTWFARFTTCCFVFFCLVLVLTERIDLVRQILVFLLDFGLHPSLLVHYARQLELLLRVEITQIFALLVL